MAKFQLTISSEYVSDWSAYEGVRESIQNALDGKDAGHPMHISYSGSSSTLNIANFGVRLDRSVWLMGSTSKAGTDARGHFGEGLKLGALALVRAGRKLRIVNDDEDWLCTLEESKAFPGQQVLTVTTRKRPTPLGAFSVQVLCSKEEWSEWQDAFIDLKPRALKSIAAGGVQILTDPTERGRCYVKGIFVEEKPDLYAGYNFNRDVRTDRDRRVMNSFDFDFHAGNAWISALTDGEITPIEILAMLQSAAPDAKATGNRYCPASGIEAVGDAWTALHGASSVPVLDQAGATEAGHYGRIGIIASSATCAFFEDHPTLSLKSLRAAKRNDVTATYGLSDLTYAERAVYQAAIETIAPTLNSMGITPIAPRLSLVDFQCGDVLGLHRFDREESVHQVLVARRTLDSLPRFLQVLVHEIAHDFGGDGEVAHERAEGEIFSKVISRLLDAALVV
jgi:hypothetical protein